MRKHNDAIINAQCPIISLYGPFIMVYDNILNTSIDIVECDVTIVTTYIHTVLSIPSIMADR